MPSPSWSPAPFPDRARTLADVITSSSSAHALAEVVADHALDILGATRVEVRLRVGPAQAPVTVRRPDAPWFLEWSAPTPAEPQAEATDGTRRPLVWTAVDTGTAGVRLQVGDDHWAMLRVHRDGGGSWPDPGGLAQLETLAFALGIGMAQLRQVGELRALADADPLTGLANRRGLQCAAETALAGQDGEVGVLVADVDGLKRVNDTWGHAAGDRLLQAVARCLCRTFEQVPHRLVARTGGDEFCVLVNGISPAELRTLAGRACAAGRRLPFGGRLSVGIATAGRSGPPVDFAQLYALADAAQYEAKRAGGDRVRHSRIADAC
ncbi:MAG TPA: GGDEF domain-containing protein [Kineosporiaceae bacterium]|nr:GGDEF domain-containing protein [Kineosporiaceae bacterium]